MRVFAIDPGYGRCGIAVVERAGTRDALVYSDCIETSPHADFADRLHAIVSECRSVIDVHKPDCIAMEKVFFAKSRKTAMQVAEVRGAILAIAADAALPVYEYTPAQIKNAAAGYGGADKKQIVKMLRALVRIDKEIRLDDEYDAIAVGVAHMAYRIMRAARAL